MNSWQVLGIIMLVLVVAGIGYYVLVELGIGVLALNLGMAFVGLMIIYSYPTNAFAWLFGLAMVAIGGFNAWHMISQLRSKGHLLADEREAMVEDVRKHIDSDN